MRFYKMCAHFWYVMSIINTPDIQNEKENTEKSHQKLSELSTQVQEIDAQGDVVNEEGLKFVEIREEYQADNRDNQRRIAVESKPRTTNAHKTSTQKYSQKLKETWQGRLT